MYDVTWSLSRGQVAKLWENGAAAALTQLSRSPAESRLLFCHLIYYGGNRDEFYSPVKTDLLSQSELRPSHVLLLIDDVYDSYLRLTAPGKLFDPVQRLPEHFGRIAEDEGVNVERLAEEDHIALCAEWQIGVMTQLLYWRHLEIVMAANFARQLHAHFMVWGTKQLTSVAAAWLKAPEPLSVYLSHPISRPRRKLRSTGEWHEVVHQFNELQGALANHGLVCVMPSAIDEHRISRQKTPGALSLRLPVLEERWPLPATPDALVYATPADAGDVHHERVLAPKRWHWAAQQLVEVDREPDGFVKAFDKTLRTFERQVEMQISTRDHLFVSVTSGIIIFRPLFDEGRYSSGVHAEIVHWKLLAKTEPGRRACFVHFSDDVRSLLSIYRSPDLLEVLRSEVRGHLVAIVSEEAGTDKRNADQIVDYLEAGRPAEMLERAPVPPTTIDRIAAVYRERKRLARNRWILDKLSGVDIGIEGVSQRQIAVWVFAGPEELRGTYDQVAAFFRSGSEPTDTLAAIDAVVERIQGTEPFPALTV